MYVLEGVIIGNVPRFTVETFEILTIILPYRYCHVYKIYWDRFYLLICVKYSRMGLHIKAIGWLDYFVASYGVQGQDLSEIGHSRIHKRN
ncbi:MAG: hypothetical protein CL891_03695 [Dehalococcoidia bacterium]|nr:hypothetical protein [Dehalococcoidia bacterium]